MRLSADGKERFLSDWFRSWSKIIAEQMMREKGASFANQMREHPVARNNSWHKFYPHSALTIQNAVKLMGRVYWDMMYGFGGISPVDFDNISQNGGYTPSQTEALFDIGVMPSRHNTGKRWYASRANGYSIRCNLRDGAIHQGVSWLDKKHSWWGRYRCENFWNTSTAPTFKLKFSSNLIDWRNWRNWKFNNFP